MVTKPTDGEVCADDEKNESRTEMKNLDCEEEREGKMEMEQSENEEKCEGVKTVERYNRDKPPEDDCCPICFDDFQFPCRTSCGHWFCSSCILQLWRYSATILCKCPICGCFINNLVPESCVLTQPGDEVGKILKKIQQYNRLSTGGWSVLFMEAVRLTPLIGKCVIETLGPMFITLLSITLIGMLLCTLHLIFDMDLYPYGMLFITIFSFGSYGLVIYVLWIVHGRRWIGIIRRRLRNLAGVFLAL